MEHPGTSLSKVHPMVLFWIGVLTGALVVGIIFLYGTYQATNLQDRMFNTPSFGVGTTTTEIQGPGF